jgi:hypothetical protein
MATEKKSWNDMSREEQEARRKEIRLEKQEELLMKRLENSNEFNRDSVIRQIIEEKGITNPNSYRSEMARLNNLASNFDDQEELKLKKGYERKWNQSSTGTESNINRRNLSRDIGAASQEIEKLKSERRRGGRWENKRGGRLGTTQEINAFNSEMDRKIKEAQLREKELKDSLSIFDSQYREAERSWISQTQAEDERLEAYNEQKDQQERDEAKYGKGFRGDPGGNMQLQMQAPSSKQVGKYDGMTSAEIRNAILMEGGYRDKSGATIPYADRNQGKLGQKGQGRGRGMPKQMVQSPAMAQKRKSFVPYSAKTGRELKGAELDNLYKSELSSWQKGTSKPGSFNINRNPYYDSFKNNKYYQNKRATEYSMANFRNPNAMSDFYKNQY